MTRLTTSAFFSVIAAILAPLCAATGSGQPLALFLSPQGSDQADGASLENAVLTLSRIHAILEEKRPDRDVEVRIAPGTYRGQEVVWTYTRPEYSISFLPLKPGEMPVFDACEEGAVEGACGGGTWFTLTHGAGEKTNLIFDSLRIQNYQTALSFNGNRNNITRSNSHNIIRNCHFYRIGNISNPEVIRPSTAAIRLVNSKSNQIENNDFIDIINTQHPNRLHALYLAHHADSNQIHNNRFVNHSGDAVRVRDFSNANVITRNLFDRAGQGGAYSEWYCDQDARTDCTKATPECPSWFNEFRDNVIGNNFQGIPLEEFALYQGDSTTGCEKPSPDAERVILSGNKRLGQ
jgi:hypothetical protein